MNAKWVGWVCVVIGALGFGSMLVLPYEQIKALHLDRFGYIWAPILALTGFCVLLSQWLAPREGKQKKGVLAGIGCFLTLPTAGLGMLAIGNGGDAAPMWLCASAPLAAAGVVLILIACLR